LNKLKVTLVTGRSLAQGQAKETGKTSEKYKQSVAVCEIDSLDLRMLNVKPGESVRVSTEFGNVIVRCEASTQGPHPGIIFMPYGPWANAVMEPKTHGTGMPSMKGILAEVETAHGKEVPDVKTLLKEQYGV